jgi:hypothetical protein
MNSCAGCHNKPIVGGGGEFGTLVFVLGQRFDFTTFDHADTIHTRGTVDEAGNFMTEQEIANGRKTVAMSGSGFIEALAREITTDLRAIRDTIPAGSSAPLASKRISFGTLSRDLSKGLKSPLHSVRLSAKMGNRTPEETSQMDAEGLQ